MIVVCFNNRNTTAPFKFKLYYLYLHACFNLCSLYYKNIVIILAAACTECILEQSENLQYKLDYTMYT